MNKEANFTQDAQQSAAAAAPGSIPETGGVPPENAAPAQRSAPDPSSAGDNLADGIDLLLRAARKSLRSLDPRIEAVGERALIRLQQFDADASAAFQERARADREKLEALATELGKELSAIVERVSSRVEAAIGKR